MDGAIDDFGVITGLDPVIHGQNQGRRLPLQANAIASKPEQSTTKLAAITARNPPDTKS
jgi:hypothetical protein